MVKPRKYLGGVELLWSMLSSSEELHTTEKQQDREQIPADVSKPTVLLPSTLPKSKRLYTSETV